MNINPNIIIHATVENSRPFKKPLKKLIIHLPHSIV
jgi:hypothetical protein